MSQINKCIDILLVEDNVNDLELTLHAFKKSHTTATIHVVRDGVEALDFIFCTNGYAERNIYHQPRLILLDLKLPFVDGIEVLRRIKSDPRTQAIPVVVLTSSSEDPDVTRSYQLGANSYIVKPVDPEQFNELVNNLGLYWLSHNRPHVTLMAR